MQVAATSAEEVSTTSGGLPRQLEERCFAGGPRTLIGEVRPDQDRRSGGNPGLVKELCRGRHARTRDLSRGNDYDRALHPCTKVFSAKTRGNAGQDDHSVNIFEYDLADFRRISRSDDQDDLLPVDFHAINGPWPALYPKERGQRAAVRHICDDRSPALRRQRKGQTGNAQGGSINRADCYNCQF